MVSSATVMNSENTICRNPPGTKAVDFYKWPAQKLDEMDSTLAVHQYIQQTIRQDFTDVEKILSVPLGQDEGVWKYEHLRQCCLELNSLAVRLYADCTPETCTQMTATEQWIYLCAAHTTPKECPAIDYTRHTLDGAASLLNNNKYFPSRVSIKESSVAKLGSVCRRVYRIFSHAYYHHRQIFDEAENETFLCRRFTSFVVKYNLMSRDNLIVPILSDSSKDVNSSNNNSVKASLATSYSIAKKPSNTPSGITSFLNLPEGVVPDVDDVEIDEQFSDVLDDVDDSGALVDDDFAYSGDAHYGTLKPMKEASESMSQEDATKEEPLDSEPTDMEDKATLDSTVIHVTVEESDSADAVAQDPSVSAQSPVEDED